MTGRNLFHHRIWQIAGVALLVALAGCGVNSKKAAQAEAEAEYTAVNAAILTLSQSGLEIPVGAKFAWLPEAVEFYDDPRFKGNEIQRSIADSIVATLTLYGFPFTSDAAEADFLVAYTAALSTALDDDEILRRYGLVPGGISPSASVGDNFEKGTLLIHLVKNGTRSPVWRAAVEARVTLDLDERERRRRIDVLVGRIFALLPVAPQ